MWLVSSLFTLRQGTNGGCFRCVSLVCSSLLARPPPTHHHLSPIRITHHQANAPSFLGLDLKRCARWRIRVLNCLSLPTAAPGKAR